MVPLRPDGRGGSRSVVCKYQVMVRRDAIAIKPGYVRLPLTLGSIAVRLALSMRLIGGSFQTESSSMVIGKHGRGIETK